MPIRRFAALRDTLLLAHGRRLPPVETTDELAASPSSALGADDLRHVSAARRTYRFLRSETRAADGERIIAPREKDHDCETTGDGRDEHKNKRLNDANAEAGEPKHEQRVGRGDKDSDQ